MGPKRPLAKNNWNKINSIKIGKSINEFKQKFGCTAGYLMFGVR